MPMYSSYYIKSTNLKSWKLAQQYIPIIQFQFSESLHGFGNYLKVCRLYFETSLRICFTGSPKLSSESPCECRHGNKWSCRVLISKIASSSQCKEASLAMTLKVQYGNCVLDECSHSQDASGQGTYSAFEKCHGHAIKQKKKKKCH